MILLTGASGFIGRHLLAALIEEYGINNVCALTSGPLSECRYLLHNNYQFDESYFMKSGVAEAITVIIHAGAFTPKNSSQGNNWQLCNDNIFNTEKLLKSTLPNLKKFIFLSTLDVYGADELISENSPIEPVSLYGYSKLYGEKMIAAWSQAENKICQVLRIGHVYGPGEEAYQKIIPVTMKKLITNQPLQIWGSGKELRSFIYVKDISRAILNSIQLSEGIGVVNLVSSQPISIGKLVDKLITISGQKHIPETVATNTPGRNLVFDNTKMKEYLLNSETSLDEGLKWEWEYMRKLFG